METETIELKKASAEWIASLHDWTTFNTLTFREPREPDVAWYYYRRLLQVLNIDAFGKHYIRKVGHCYYPYVVAMEYQKREVVHFHFLCDRPLHFDLIHGWWGAAAGFAYLEKIDKFMSTMDYMTKYETKSDSGFLVYENLVDKTPLIKGPVNCVRPWWWVTPKG